MALSLDEFMTELRTKVDQFEADYRQEASENPEQYPLTMENGNEGLWIEFFFDFFQRCETRSNADASGSSSLG